MEFDRGKWDIYVAVDLKILIEILIFEMVLHAESKSTWRDKKLEYLREKENKLCQ